MPVVARPVATFEDRVREMIQRFNELGSDPEPSVGAVPARSRLTTRRTSLKRPRPDPEGWAPLHRRVPASLSRLSDNETPHTKRHMASDFRTRTRRLSDSQHTLLPRLGSG